MELPIPYFMHQSDTAEDCLGFGKVSPHSAHQLDLARGISNFGTSLKQNELIDLHHNILRAYLAIHTRPKPLLGEMRKQE